MLERFFRPGEHGTAVRTGVAAGATTILAMAHVPAVGPQVPPVRGGG